MLAIGLVALVCLCAGTRSQVRVWHDSISLWTRVLARYPDAATAHSNLASALGERGRDEEAMRRFQRAVALNPMLSEAHYGLGITRARRGELEQACLSFRRALSIRPRQVDYWNNLGGVLLQLDRASEAIDALEQASRLDPSNGLVQYNLGQALIRSGRLTEALARLRAAAALAPEVPSILETLAWSLATCDDDSLRNAEEALELATRSVRLTEGKSASCLDAQAAAYAELGRFDEAVTAASAALTIARATGDGRLADEIEQRLVMYRAGQPYHASHQ